MTVSCSINGLNLSIEEIEKIALYSEAIDRAVEAANKRLKSSMFPCNI